MNAKDILREIFAGHGFNNNGIYVQEGLKESDLMNKRNLIPQWVREKVGQQEELYAQTVEKTTEYIKDQLDKELIEEPEAVSKLQSQMKKYAEDNLI